jgi:hypothetical protein
MREEKEDRQSGVEKKGSRQKKKMQGVRMDEEDGSDTNKLKNMKKRVRGEDIKKRKNGKKRRKKRRIT